jgi:hypothetical protein
LNFIDRDATDRVTRFYLLLINATIDGPIDYQDEIDQLANLSNPSDIEKEIVGKILLLPSKPREEGHPTYQPHARLRDQSFDEFDSAITPGSQSRENSEHRRRDESEPAAFNQPLAEIDASKDHDAHSSQVTVNTQAQLPKTKDAALDDQEMRYRETIRYLENRLSEKDELLESHDTELQAIRAKIDQLTAQIAELADTKDREVGLLREELAQRSEILQVKDDAIRNLEAQLAAQVSALENQLSEIQNLLQNRDAELESLTARLSELAQERADLKSEQAMVQRSALEDLRENTILFQATATAIDELEERSSAIVASYQRQLAEQQEIVDQRGTELAALRGQIAFLTERLADAEAARRSAENIIPHNELDRANQSMTAAHSADDGAADAPFRPTMAIDTALTYFRDKISAWRNGMRRAWQMTWRPITIPKTALPVAGGVLLIIPIAYFLSGQGRTAAKSETNVSVTHAPVKQTLDREARGNSRLPANELKTPQSASTNNQQIGQKREARPARATTYVTRRVVPLREYPRYAAGAKTQIQSGARISVLESEGNWLKVETQPPGAVGYVRKEHLVAQNSAQY